MDNYIVSARKYRPMTFDSVVGQESLTTTLKNSIRTGRLAHAYLFCGPRGVGKTTCARIFAKTINCLHSGANGEACGECESCVAFNEQRSYNIHELDAASNNSVDDIRTLIEQVRIPPQVGRYKVFIIDEVHMLSTQAFNAFLKTLEEPPAHAIFILATTEKHKLLPTILSRCQIYDFSRMTVKNTVEHLKKVAEKENISYEESALNVIAQKADGGMRDALSIFDQVASFCGGNITYQRTIENLNVLDTVYFFKLTDFFLTKNITEIMLTLNEILNKGFDGQHFITGLSSHFRDLLVSRDAQTVKLIEATDDVRNHYAEQAKRCSPKFLFRAMKLCNDCDLNYRQSQNKRLLVELTLIEVAQATDDDTGSGLGPVKILKPIFSEEAAKVQSSQSAQNVKSGQGERKFMAGGVTAVNSVTVNAKSMNVNPLQPRKIVADMTNQSGGMAKRTLGFSIRGGGSISNANEQNPSVSNGIEPKESVVAQVKPVDHNELVVAWKEFAGELPQNDTAMANRMTAIQPKLIGEAAFEVVVQNPTVQEQFQTMSPRILDYLRNRLQNSNLSMTVRVAEVVERPKILSKVEQLNLMCKENPALKKLCEEFGLGLG